MKMIRRPIGSSRTDAMNTLNDKQTSSWTINTAKSTSWINRSYITNILLLGEQRLYDHACYSVSWTLIRKESRAWGLSTIKTINKI